MRNESGDGWMAGEATNVALPMNAVQSMQRGAPLGSVTSDMLPSRRCQQCGSVALGDAVRACGAVGRRWALAGAGWWWWASGLVRACLAGGLHRWPAAEPALRGACEGQQPSLCVRWAEVFLARYACETTIDYHMARYGSTLVCI